MSATKFFPITMTAANRGALRSATALGRVLTVAAAATALSGQDAAAGPKNGVVKAGAATITTRGGTTTINQSGQKVVIDWKSFDIDANEAVNFLQPGKDSIALNRVLNDLPTHIRGQLTANGNVWIVNQHGVTFHAGAMVNVGSLIATTADIANADFMAGNYKFDKPGDPNAQIINEGDITFGEAGLAAFVAPNASNRGVIAGRMGKVVIAGNETFAVDLAGDGMWAFTMGEGANAASASNSGRIHNPGGYILISARAAQGMVDSNISVGGVIEATTARVEGGRIVLSGDGFVEVAGSLDATGAEAGQVGGSIEVTGDKVHVTATAKIDASGDAGGGTIKIGGDYQGGGALKTASRTLISEGAEIAASAIGQVGDGGEVIVWADEVTGFFGSIRATGGANAGDGGFAEVSGKRQLAFDGMVDLSARNGLPGKLLLDPDAIVIGVAGGDDAELDDNEILAGDPGPVFNISTNRIETLLNAGTDLYLQATNTITLEAGSSITATGTGDLELNAISDGVYLNGDITLAGNLTLATGGQIAAGAGVVLTGFDVSLTSADALALGSITALNSLSVQSVSGAITDVTGAVIDVTGTTMLTAGGGISFDEFGNRFSGVLSVSDANFVQIATLAPLTLGEITLDPTGGAMANVLRSITGKLTLGGDLTDAGGDFLLFGFNGGVEQTAGVITAANVRADSAGDVTLDGANAFTGFASTAANVSLTVAGEIDLGEIAADTLTVNAGGDVTDSGDTVVAGATSITAIGFDITLDNAGIDFADAGVATSDFTGATIIITDSDTIELGTVTASVSATVTAENADADVTPFTGGLTELILNDTEGDVVLAPPLVLAGTITDFTLSSVGAIEAQALSLPGVNLTLDAAAEVSFTTGASTVAGLEVIAGGDVTQTVGVEVTGATSVSAAGQDVTLDNAANDFSGPVALSGQTVVIRDANDLQLDDIAASTLTVNASGAVTQASAGSLTITTTTAVTTTGDILLANAANVISGDVALSGEDINLDAGGDITLGAITASSAAADTTIPGAGDVTISGGAVVFGGALTGVNDLDVIATGAVTQTTAITAGGVLDVDAAGQAVTLSNTSNDFNDVDIDGAVVSLGDIDDIALGAISASDLTVNAGGSITEAMGAVIDVDGPASLTATNDIDIRIQDTHRIDGAVTLSAAQIVDFATAGGVTFGDVTTTNGANVENRLTSASGVMALDGTISVAGTSDLYLRSGGPITQTGAITADQLRLSGYGAKTLGGANDVNSLNTPGIITSLVFNDTDGVDLAGVSASTLTITAGGAVTDSATNTISSATSITATGADITLDEAGSSFGTLALAGAAATVRNVADLEFGDVDASTLTVSASGTVTQTAATSLTVTTTTDVTAGEDILLANAANAISGDVSLSGEDINLDAGGDITLGAITASNTGNDSTIPGAGDVTISGGAIAFGGALTGVHDLDVIATGAVTQSNAITVGGALDVEAAGQTVDLSNAANDFQGPLDAEASAVTLFDANDLQLGLISADALIANAGGDITDGAAKIEARTVASFTAGDDIIIDTLDTHVFGGTVDLSADQITRFAASGSVAFGMITATNMTDVVNRITVTDGLTLNGAVSTAGLSDLTLETTNAIVVQQSGTLTTDVLTLDIGTGDGTFTAGTTDINTLRAPSAANIALTDTDGVTIGSVDATMLTVIADAAIDQEAGSTITLAGLGDFTTTGDAVTLTQAGNDFATVTVDTTARMSTAADVAITDANAVELGDIDAASLTVIAGGDVSQTTGTRVSATGTTTLTVTGGDADLSNAANDFATVTASANNVALTDANAITLQAVTASAGSVTVTAAGDLTVEADADISATDNILLTTTGAGATLSASGATQITADSDTDLDGDVTLRAADGSVQTAAGVAVSGANAVLDGATLTSSGTITATAGDIDIDATGAATLDGAVTATTPGSIVEIDAGGEIIVTTIDAAQISAETTGGSITQTSGAITTAAGTDVSDFTATADVTLDQAGNDFGGPVELTGQSLTIRDATALVLDDVKATGTFTVNAGGAVTQTTATATISGTTTITAAGQTIDLSNANEFRSTVVATGGDVSFTDINAIELGLIDASTLTITSGGDVSQSAGATVANETTVNSPGRTVDLNNSANAFTGVVNVTGGAVEIDNTIALGLGNITASSLDAQATTGDVTNTTDDVLSVTGATTITSDAGSVTILSDGANSEDLRQIVTLSAAGDISLTGVNTGAVTLGDVISGGGSVTVNVSNQSLSLTGDVGASMGGDAVTLRSAGDIIQSAGRINAAELTVSSGANTVTLESETNAISTLTLGSNGTVSVVEADGLAIGQEAAGGQAALTLRSGGAITQTSSLTVTSSADFTTEGAAITLDATGNSFVSVSADTTYNMAGANAVTLVEADATELAGITATSATVTSGGAITQTGAVDASAAGAFTATGDINLVNPANDFADAMSGSVADFSGYTVNVTDSDTIALGTVTATISATITAHDAGNSGVFTGGLTELRFFDTLDDMVLSTTLTLPPTVVEFTADSVGSIEAQALSLDFANTLLDAEGGVSFTTGRSTFGALTVNATDDITQTAPITVLGQTDLNAPGSFISLGDATNDFQGRVDAEASAITLYDANDLQLGLVSGDTLVANAGGDITDQGARIEARNFASFTAGDDIIIDTLDTHAFGGSVSLSADQITRFAAAGTVGFDAITATNATNVVNRITVTGGMTLSSAVSTAGLSDLTLDTTNANILQNYGSLSADVLTLNIGTGDATLLRSANDINTLRASAADDISLSDVDGVTIGSVEAATLTVNAGGAIDQEAASVILLTGAADLTAPGANITLDEAGNDFATIDAEGADLTFRDANGVELTDIDASGALVVEALAGDITDGATGAAGDDVNVTGASLLTASGAITLDDATNNFGQAVSADGVAVTLRDADSIILGDIDATGALVVEAVSGAISQDGDGLPGEDINAELTSTFTASTTITLSDASNDFVGVVDASGTGVALTDVNALTLGDIEAMTLTATATSIDDGAPVMAMNGDIDVAGTTTLTATTGDVALDDATNNFGGAVNASGATVTLTDRDAIELGDIDATTLIVTATTIDDGAPSIGPNDDVDVSGATTLTATGAITLDDATNDFGGAVAAAGQAITLRDANSIILGDVDAGGALVVEAVSGAISQDGDGALGEDINAATTSSFAASTTITLTDASNDFVGAVSAGGTDVSVTDVTALELADIDAASLSVIAATIADGDAGAAGEDVNVTGLTALTAAGDITLDDATNDFGGAVAADGSAITLRDANSIVLGDVDARGVLVVDAVSGAISQDGDGAPGDDINAAAEASFTASTTITLTDASNDFAGAVNADGTAVSIVDLTAIELADIDATSLTVSAMSIDDGAAGAPGDDVNVTGATSLTASTTITLDDATNDFGGAVAAGGQAITLRDANSIILGDIDAGGVLTVEAVSGAISQDGDGAPGGDVNAAAEASFTASTTITLTDASNDFEGVVNADGTDIAVRDLNAIELGDIDATTLAVTAGSIDDGASTMAANGDVDVAGTTTLTATGDITLDDATNNFGQAVSADGASVTLRDVDNIVLGEVAASGSLTITAAGAITDSGTARVAVGGATTLTASGNGVYFDIALDNDTATDRHDLRGAVNALGQDITLINGAGIILGTVTTNGGTPDDTINVDGGAEATDPGELIIIARGGAITQEMGNALTVTGDATLEATTGAGTYFDITLTNTLNAFDSDNADAVGDGDTQADHVTFLGETVTINDTGPFLVFDSVANAGGVLTSQSGDLTIERLRVNAANGALAGVALDGAVYADGLSGGSITLGGAGSTDGAAMAASGVVTVDNFSVDALAVASDVSTTLTNGDAGAALRVAAPLQTFTFVTTDAFADGAATDFNAVTGSTADQLILERMAFDGDITIAAGDLDLGHIAADDGLFVTALTGDISKRADADLDFAGAQTATFSVAGARGAADETVTLQTFDTLVSVGGAASFTAASGDVVITRGLNGGAFKEVDLQGPVSIAATDAAIEDRNSLQLGQVAVDDKLAIRINSDNAGAAAETLTQTATQTITVGGDLALITGFGATDRSDVTLANAGNSFTNVSALAANLSIRGGDDFTILNTDLSGGLSIGAAGAQHGGGLILQDVRLGGDLNFDATGAATLTRLDVAGATGVTGQAGDGLAVADLRTDNRVDLTTTGGDLSVTDAVIGAFDLDSAGALTITNLATAGSGVDLSTAVGDITVANIVSDTNASFDSTGGALDIDSARIGSTLTLSANGDVALGAIAVGDDLSARSDTASVLIRDAATEAPADIVTDGVQAAEIGFATGPLVGDPADERVMAATTGTAGATVDPAEFTLQLSVGGNAAFNAAGSVLLPREAASEGGLHNDFMGDVALSAATGNVVIEDATALSFSTVTITAGELSARSNADNSGSGEGITQTAAISVGGAASLVTGDHGGAAIADAAILADVTLTNAGNDFTGAVSVVADNATLSDANAITVANARLDGDLSVSNASAAASDGATLNDVQTGGATTVDVAGPVDLDRIAVGGALSAQSRLAGVTANDLAVTGATGLTALTTIALDDALLADATITAGASGSLSDVLAQVINVETGGVTISGLSATTTTITSTAAADIEQISTGSTTITVADSLLALSQAEVAGSLTARAGTGAITLADLNVIGDAIIDGGAIGSDASGGGETRLRVSGALDLDGATVDLTDLAVLGATALDATGDVTLDDASFAALTLNGASDVIITDAGASTTTLNVSGALDVTNMRMGALTAVAVGNAELEAVEIAGAADIRSSGAALRLGSVDVGGSLAAEAVAGSVTTFEGTRTLAEVMVAAPVGAALPEFVVEGPVVAEIGAEATLANSPAGETRVQETLTAVADQTNPALNGDQAGAVTLTASANDRLLSVAGAVTITAASDLTLDDADLADATLTVGGAATLTSVAADTLSVTTGGALSASVLNAGDTTIISGGAADLEDVATASTTITVTDRNLAVRRVETSGPLTIATGAGDIALADLNVADDAMISGADIGSDASGAGETRVSVGGALSVDATGSVALTDLSVAGASEIAAGGAVSLDDIELAATTITAGGDLLLRDGRTGVTTLNSAAALSGSNLRTALLDADAAGDIDLDAMQVTGDASILSTTGDIALGSVAISGQLAAESAAGVIRTSDSDFALAAVTVSGADPAAIPSFGANTVPADADVLIGAETNATLLSVGGDAYFLAAGDIALVDDEVGTTGDNDLMGRVTAISGGSVMINDVNDLVLGARSGVATPGGGTFDSNGVTAAGSLRIEAGGDVTDALLPRGRLDIGGDVMVLAGGDVLLDNEIHAIGGAIAATGRNVTLTERGSIRLGPINASGDLLVEAGADNGTGEGTTGGASILQDSTVTVANAAVGAVATDETSVGAITVAGASAFTTGLNPATDLDDPSLTGRRDLVLDDPANDFGGRLNVARISGDATITENSLPGAISGVQEVGNFEIGGTARLTTTDNVIFVGRMTALTDDVDPAVATSRPETVPARSQGDLGIADADLRLFVTTGESLIIDTTGGGVSASGAGVRFDRPVDGDNNAAPLGSPTLAAERAGLGALTVTGGTGGEVRFRDFVGAQNPLGDVDINAGAIFAGFTFAEDTPDLLLPGVTGDNRFLFDRTAPNDFFFADDVRVNAPGGRIEFLTPFGTVDQFILVDRYFGVNVTTFDFGDLGDPATIQAFGFIGRDRTRSIGLLPTGPRGPDFQFNDCVIGDVADCTNIPIPNVINNVLIAAPPLLGIDTEDLLELFGSFGNEELWGVPQSYYSDLGTEQENKPDCPEGSDDPACKES